MTQGGPSDAALPICFATRQSSRENEWSAIQSTLEPPHDIAFARLLEVLLCGEESAALTFREIDLRLARNTLCTIADDELRHERMLRSLRAKLPQPDYDETFSRKARRFFRTIETRDIGLHLASIAALDSAICQILRSLLKPGAPLASDSVSAEILRKIWRDEARHVAISLATALPLTNGKTRNDRMTEVRGRLIDFLSCRAAEFDALHVDPDVLFSHLRTVPRNHC